MGNTLARADRLRTRREGHARVWTQAMLRSLCESEGRLVRRGHAHWCLARHMPHATLRYATLRAGCGIAAPRDPLPLRALGA